MRRIAVALPLALIPAAWLVTTNHYPPWVAAWANALAMAGLLLLLVGVMPRAAAGVRVSWPLAGFGALCLGVVLAQLLGGKLFFAGDAVMAVFYVALWLAAVLAGSLVAEPASRRDGIDTLATAWLLVALLSVGIALVQWTGALDLGVFAARLPRGGRPFGNLAQPNNFSTLCFVGLCGLLWLHQRQRVSGMPFWLGAGFLFVGMVASQSRTAWLQIALLVGWGLALRTRAALRITRAQLLALGAVFAALALAWPWIADALMLSVGRTLDDQMRPGMRLPYWRMMLDALEREPLWGYGWQQVGAAQQRVALDHPGVGALFEHSHNLVLDLLLWNGVPLGSLFVAALAWWFIGQIRACRDARVAWLLAAVGGVLAHGMLEFPLAYVYFLVPVGLAMGAVQAYSPAGVASFKVPRRALLAFTLVLGLTFAGVAHDYLKLEENYRVLDKGGARATAAGSSAAPAPRLRVLTQLDAYLQFTRVTAKPGMSPQTLDWMRKVSERFGYPPVLLHYALASGLNGQSEAARAALARVCRIQSPYYCREIRKRWAALQAHYPQLAGVALPD